MKGIKWKLSVKSFVLFMSIFAISVINSANTNAQDYYDAIRVDMSSTTLYYDGGGSALTSLTTTYASFVNNTGNDKLVNQFNICRTQNFPKNTLIYFNLYNSDYKPIQLTSTSNNYSVISTTYGEYGNTSFVVYLDHSANEYNCLSFSTAFNMFSSTLIRLERPNGIILNDGASYTQITQLSSQIVSMIANQETTNDTLDDILAAINGLSFSGITGAINAQSQQQHSDSQAEQQKLDNIGSQIEEQNDKDDQDRSDISDQQSDIDGDAQDSADDASATGTTLLVAATGFVNNFSYAVSHPASNCRILMNMGNLNLGNVDLCALSLPEPLQALAPIFLVLFCVPLSFATARRFVSLIRSFQK